MNNRSAWQTIAQLIFISLTCASLAQAQDEFVYWVDEANQQIWRGRVDGTAAEAVVKPRLPAALDIAHDTLYWVDSAAKAILRRALLGGSQTDTLITDLVFFVGESTVLELDPSGRKMFWLSGTGQEHTYNLYRANLDGTDMGVVIEDVHLLRASALAVDGQSGKLYWAEKTPDVSMHTIRRANLDGTGVETVIPGLNSVRTLALDTSQGKLYWAENGLLRANLDGTGVETLLSDVTPFSIAVDPVLGKMYYDAGGTLQRANLDGTDAETLLTEFEVEISSLTLRSEPGDLFWIGGGSMSLSQGRILHSRLDGSGGVEEVLAAFGQPASVTLDPAHKKMYWTDGVGILRANLDGTGVETVAPYVSCGTGSATDVELDLANDKIYWGRISDCARVVGRANLDGTDVESLMIVGYDHADFIALNPSAETVYWTDTRPPTQIVRIGFDGSDGAVVVDSPACGIALDFTGQAIYWADCLAGEIRRANLDGTEAEVFLTGLDNPYDLALDLKANQLYWSERNEGKIRRANLDGTGVEDLFTGLAAPTRIALSFESNTSVTTESVEELPEAYQLWPNYPNPFNAATTLRYVLPRTGHVVLTLYDVQGRQVRVLLDGTVEAGTHEVTFEAGNLPSGIYFYRLETTKGSFMQRMLLVK